ncbi:MAG: hypothetical protein WC457_04670 [Patescibacteria group bacterium]
MKKFLLSTFIFAVSLVALPSIVFGAGDYGLGMAATTGGLTSSTISQAGDIPTMLGYIISIALSLVGVFFFILILYAGIIWMTAAGAADRVESAKKKMMSAAIGLVIVLSAYAIANFVFSNLLRDQSAVDADNLSSFCAASPAGTVCAANKVCDGNQCVEECLYTFKEHNGSCINMASDPCAGVILSGKCSGGKKCCVPSADYDNWETSVLTDTSETTNLVSEESGTSACEKKAGHFCATKAICESGAYNGAGTEQNGCDSGEVCCNNCVQLGGNCIDNTKYTCGPDNVNFEPGYCHGAFGANKFQCCLGTYTLK